MVKSYERKKGKLSTAFLLNGVFSNHSFFTLFFVDSKILTFLTPVFMITPRDNRAELSSFSMINRCGGGAGFGGSSYVSSYGFWPFDEREPFDDWGGVGQHM
jgi:hypothetical protein